jgi:nucleotide-binding universal stress UspA family protein
MTSNIVGRPVVAAVDGSTSSLHAAVWAADEAARLHAPLRLVHAVNFTALAYIGGVAPPQSFFDDLESGGREQLVQAQTAIHQVHPDLDVDIALRTADPVPALIGESDNARLIVLGSRGLGGFTGILVGSTAVALVTHAHCPVVVVRGHTLDAAPPAHGPVVVGVDGSPASEPALAMALEEASFRGVDLVAVHAWIDFTSDRVFAYARQVEIEREAVENREREMLAERLAGWQEKYPDVTVRSVVTRDPPVSGLLAHSSDAQLLVVGSRGRGGFAGMVLGSTSQALVYHAACPLLVVPSTISH